MSATVFPIGTRVRLPVDRWPRFRSGLAHSERYLVIGESWLVKGETELMLDREVTHPDWMCVPLVAVCSIAEAREITQVHRTPDRSDDICFRDYFGDDTKIYFADVADLVVDDAVPA